VLHVVAIIIPVVDVWIAICVQNNRGVVSHSACGIGGFDINRELKYNPDSYSEIF
jgi:hypothetical protein